MESEKTLKNRIREELNKNPLRYDNEIAEAIGVPTFMVRNLRSYEKYPRFTPYVKRRIEIEEYLTKEPQATDDEVAEIFSCCPATVATYRLAKGLPKAPRVKRVSDKTMKARQMLLDNPELNDLYISRESGISFAHVARQRDLLGLQRSRGKRTLKGRRLYDYSAIDIDITTGDISYGTIALRYKIPYSWVLLRAKEIGAGNRRRVSGDKKKKVMELLMLEPRPKDSEIAKIVGGCSGSYVSNLRKELGIKRLPPGLPKYEETRKAEELLRRHYPHEKSLAVIATEAGLTVATVTKIRNRISG